ncbi:unnamed protein product, partial [Brassica rapa subsp. narinosa]
MDGIKYAVFTDKSIRHRLPRKVKRMGPILGHTMHYRR